MRVTSSSSSKSLEISTALGGGVGAVLGILGIGGNPARAGGMVWARRAARSMIASVTSGSSGSKRRSWRVISSDPLLREPPSVFPMAAPLVSIARLRARVEPSGTGTAFAAPWAQGSGGPDYALSALFGPVEMEPIRRTDVAPALERARVPLRHGEQP